MPATPDGPAVPVAVMYCVPALAEATDGPAMVTVGVSLSTYTDFGAQDVFCAASVAVMTSAILPSPSPSLPYTVRVSTWVCQRALGHCCQVSAWGTAPGPGILVEPTMTCELQMPLGSVAPKLMGRVPRTQLLAVQRAPAGVMVGLAVSVADRSTSPTVIEAGRVHPERWAHSRSQPKC